MLWIWELTGFFLFMKNSILPSLFCISEIFQWLITRVILNLGRWAVFFFFFFKKRNINQPLREGRYFGYSALLDHSVPQTADFSLLLFLLLVLNKASFDSFFLNINAIDFFFFFLPPLAVTWCGISVARPGIEPRPWWKCQILATRPPGNSQCC